MLLGMLEEEESSKSQPRKYWVNPFLATRQNDMEKLMSSIGWSEDEYRNFTRLSKHKFDELFQNVREKKNEIKSNLKKYIFLIFIFRI